MIPTIVDSFFACPPITVILLFCESRALQSSPLCNQAAIKRRNMDQYMPICRDCQTHNLPYECDSIMHYGWMDFASIGRLLAFLQPTMTAKHPDCHLTSDGGVKPTKADWAMANIAQRCGVP